MRFDLEQEMLLAAALIERVLSDWCEHDWALDVVLPLMLLRGLSGEHATAVAYQALALLRSDQFALVWSGRPGEGRVLKVPGLSASLVDFNSPPAREGHDPGGA